jgi:quercetin dioxygenase-like cupin family protein
VYGAWRKSLYTMSNEMEIAVNATVETIRFQGLTTRVLHVDEGAALIEHELVPRGLGSPVHTHRRETEVSYVLEGVLGAQLGDDVLERRAGDVLVKPAGTPHAFWNPGDEPLRFVELITPGRFVSYFRDVEPLLGGDGPPDMAAFAEVAARYELDVDPASVPRLAAEHALALG